MFLPVDFFYKQQPVFKEDIKIVVNWAYSYLKFKLNQFEGNYRNSLRDLDKEIMPLNRMGVFIKYKDEPEKEENDRDSDYTEYDLEVEEVKIKEDVFYYNFDISINHYQNPLVRKNK